MGHSLRIHSRSPRFRPRRRQTPEPPVERTSPIHRALCARTDRGGTRL
ncbi:hypothetical protein FM105_07600 [Brevibacterium yomogidense]|uniref:Uncharacterized protein n=1 Tax=Brevibacterium yomogidense TaxID=946573 RepID=A0A1X6XF16_9MICO|nr:hypothetical protein FM105_07600 [Brevibacterium yomogidense]